MEEPLNFVFSSTIFMISIFSAMIIGIIIIYIIRYDTESNNRKVLHYIPLMLAIIILSGIVFTYGFINPEQWNKYFTILEYFFLIIFIFYFAKLLMIFPKLKYERILKIGIITTVSINILLIFTMEILGNSEFIYIMQNIFLILGFLIFYIFTVLFLIFLEQKNKKVLCLEWKRRGRKNET